MRGVQVAARAMACATRAMPSSSAPGSIDARFARFALSSSDCRSATSRTWRPTGPASSCPSTSRSMTPFAVICKRSRSTARLRARVAQIRVESRLANQFAQVFRARHFAGQRRIVQVGILLQIRPDGIGSEKRRAGGNAGWSEAHDRAEGADPSAGVIRRAAARARASERRHPRRTVRERERR